MRRDAIAVALALTLSLLCANAVARGGGGHSRPDGHGPGHSATGKGEKAGQHQSSSAGQAKHSKSSKSPPRAVKRDADGRIHRSAEARDEFKKLHPCPATGKTTGRCPGYVIDHKVPLKRGGADAPSNMQWQTTAAAKAKDRWE